jgi:hypothetical protein
MLIMSHRPSTLALRPHCPVDVALIGDPLERVTAPVLELDPGAAGQLPSGRRHEHLAAPAAPMIRAARWTASPRSSQIATDPVWFSCLRTLAVLGAVC